MTERTADPTAVDEPLFMFASGFGFGVSLTLLILAVAGSAIDSGSVSLSAIVGSDLATPLIAGAVFTLIVAIGLYVLSYPRNRDLLTSKIGR